MKQLIFIALVSVVSLNAQININPKEEHQTVEGWGASLVWWAHMVGQWDDEEKIDEIVDVLVLPEHLNMNVFRYNIGGGDDPSHYSTPEVPGHMAKGKGLRAEMEGFLDSASADYNWTRDAGQRKILLKIKEKRPDVVFEAFSNSPPYWMTYSGCSAGNHKPNQDNLKPEYYEAFCDYLIAVCLHYKNEYGIEFKTLEPFNEPQTSYWNYKGSQEGCHFDIASQIKIIKILYPKLKSSGLNTVIAASDETSVRSFNKAMRAYIQADITSMLGQVNVHTYKVDNAAREEALRLSREIGVDFWQSETGPQDVAGRNFENNLGLAQRLIDDMNIMQPQAWLDWQIMEEHNNTWCLIRGSFEKESYKLIKNLYVRQQVTKYIKAGYVIIDSDNQHTLAAISPDKQEIVIVYVNLSSEDVNTAFRINGVKHIKACDVSYTSQEVNEESASCVSINKNLVSSTIEAKSIQTLVLSL